MLFCTTIDKLRAVIEAEIKISIDRVMTTFLEAGLSLDDMHRQQVDKSGPYYEAVSAAVEDFSRKTEYVEAQLGIELARIYDFGTSDDLQICFYMKTNFDGQVNTLQDFIDNFEDDTHVDCTLRSGKMELRFQIKRYPSEYLDFTTEGILTFIEKVSSKYGNMTGTNLVILLQPGTREAAITAIDFDHIHKILKSRGATISFDEVAFVFNANMKEIALLRVFPNMAQGSVPLELRSEEYQKEQGEWEEKMRRLRDQGEPED